MWRGDDRGQSIQIGAVLLFGALIVALAGYQAFVVPQQNKAVEFSHSQSVQDHLQDLRNTFASATGGAAPRAVSVPLGTRYPERLIAVNPGPATGSLRTAGTSDASVAVTVENAQASGETGDFWTGTTTRSYPTGGLVYRPNYNLYGEAPTTLYEHTALVNQFASGEVAVSGQSLVEGNQITLVALDGSLDATRSSAVSVDVRPVSSSERTVSVTDSGSPVTLRLPTRLDQATWRTLLADQLTTNGGHVVPPVTVNPGTPFNTLVVELETGQDYTLRMAKAGVGTDVSSTSEAYLTDISGDGTSVAEGGTQKLVVEVRDKYNNPVAGVDVTAEPERGQLEGASGPVTLTTDADGRAAFRYSAPDDVSALTEVPVEFTIDSLSGFTASDPEDVEMVVDVQNTAASGPGGGSVPYTVSWNDPDGTADGDYELDVAAEGKDLDLTAVLENTSFANKQTIEGATVDFALNDTNVGTLSSTEAVSDANGEVTTTLTAQTAGTVRVFAISGGTSDAIDISVVNVAPRITSVSLSNDGSDNLALSFDSDTQLGSASGDVTVTVDGPTSGADWKEFSRTDFTESANPDGTYTYTLTTTQPYDDGSGTYTATVDDAKDSAGNNGGENGAGSGLSDTYSFGGDTDAPSVTSASITNAPISDSDAGGPSQTVTVNFDEQMDTSQPLTVQITGLSSSPYSVSGSWSDATTWTGTVSIADDEEEATATIEVSGGQDAAGNTQSPNPDTSNTFQVDTLTPGTPNEVVVEPDLIDQGNENAVSVTVTIPDTVRDDETLVLELTDETGNTVTARQSLSDGQGGQDISFSVDVSSLADGTITPTVYVEDDVGNTGGSYSNDATTKDTQAPSIDEFIVTDTSTGGGGNSGTDVRYSVEYEVSDRTLSGVTIELLDPSDTVVETENLGASTSGTVTLGDDAGETCGGGNPNRPACTDYEIRITATDDGGLSTQRSVTDDPDGSGVNAAATTFFGGETKVPNQGSTAAVQVDVTNSGSTNVDIQTVVVTATTSSATDSYESRTRTTSGQREIHVDAVSGYLEMSWLLFDRRTGNRPAVGEARRLDRTATRDADYTGYVVSEFVDDGGTTVDQIGETVGSRAEYADRWAETISFTASDPHG